MHTFHVIIHRLNSKQRHRRSCHRSRLDCRVSSQAAISIMDRVCILSIGTLSRFIFAVGILSLYVNRSSQKGWSLFSFERFDVRCFSGCVRCWASTFHNKVALRAVASSRHGQKLPFSKLRQAFFSCVRLCPASCHGRRLSNALISKHGSEQCSFTRHATWVRGWVRDRVFSACWKNTAGCNVTSLPSRPLKHVHPIPIPNSCR